MEIKLSRLKQIISEVVEERHASERMDDIIQSGREEEVVEEVDLHDQALDEMIAEEIETAIEKFIIGEEEEVDTSCKEKHGKLNAEYLVHGESKGFWDRMTKFREECPDYKEEPVHEGTKSESE